MNGFVAGTLIHTDNGLVPIDKLKVGDMVLSRPENDPDATNEYKRVLSVFKSVEKKRITFVDYDVIENNESTGTRYLFCTEGHPFWTMAYGDNEDIHQLGWQAVSCLSHQYSHLLKTLNDNDCFVTAFDVGVNKIIEEDNSKITCLYNDGDDPIALYDFNSGQPVCIGGLSYDSLHPTETKSLHDLEMTPDMLELVDRHKSDTYYDDVFNIDVEDFHTYYVGNAGVWVHNPSAPA